MGKIKRRNVNADVPPLPEPTNEVLERQLEDLVKSLHEDEKDIVLSTGSDISDSLDKIESLAMDLLSEISESDGVEPAVDSPVDDGSAESPEVIRPQAPDAFDASEDVLDVREPDQERTSETAERGRTLPPPAPEHAQNDVAASLDELESMVEEGKVPAITSGFIEPSGGESSTDVGSGVPRGMTNGVGRGRAVGRTNGMTNGVQGRTNGLVNGAGRGRTNGMTNEAGGRTNGLTNGTGRTNGCGRTNGLTNGTGRTNGRGKTNGLTNGAGRTNGRGRTNGLTNGTGRAYGYIDGWGKVYGPGATNGLGRTNGLVNDNGSGEEWDDGGNGRRTHWFQGGRLSPRTLSAVLLVVFIIIMPVSLGLLIQSQPVPGHVANIDGDFDDWDAKVRYADTSTYGEPSLDIVEFAVAVDRTELYAYARTQGPHLEEGAVHRCFAFIDVDANPSTGYLVEGLGAEYSVEAYSTGDLSWSVSALKFMGIDQSNWSAMTSIGSGSAVSVGEELELRVSLDVELNLGGETRIRFVSMDGDDMADVCAPIVDGMNGALVVTQSPQDAAGLLSGDSLLSLDIRAVGKGVVVNSLSIDSEGVAGTEQVGFASGRIAANSAMPVTITGGIDDLLDGTLIKASVASVDVSDGTVSVVGDGLAAYAKSPPGQIAIDGAFADWSAVPMEIDDLSDAGSPSIDIAEEAAVAQAGRVFAYVRFNGTDRAMAGVAVPQIRTVVQRDGGGGGGGGGSPVPPTMLPKVSGDDVARFYIDSIAGGSTVGGIDADFVIELRGRGGQISEKRVLTYPDRVQIGNASAEIGAGAVEASATLLQIGAQAGASIKVFVETTDWARNGDNADIMDVTIQSSAGTRGILDPSWGDATTNTAVCTSNELQQKPQLVPDGQGGAIIAWQDARNGAGYDIYAQRVSASGAAQWTSNGVTVCTATGHQTYPQLVPDGQGGAIIAWHDYRGGSYTDIYAQRISAGGSVQWTANGVALCTATDDQTYPEAVPDGQGGAIIVWVDYRSGANPDVYAQRVSASGTALWAVNGVAVCAATGEQRFHQPIPDGQGGAIIAWWDYRSGTTYDIYAQRIGADGSAQWTANGVAVCTATGNQNSPQLVPDGQGGATIAWSDYRSGSNCDVYAQRMSPSGAAQWTANGVGVCTEGANNGDPQLAPDGQGGAIIVWNDFRNGNYDLYAQRVSAGGVTQWAATGVAVCTATGGQYSPKLVTDGQGGVITIWQDYRSDTSYDIYTQRVNTNGVSLWARNGLAICTATGHQRDPQITIDSRWLSGNQQMQSPEQSSTGNEAKGIIVVWEDTRSGVADIYAQAINEDAKEFKETHALDPRWGSASTNTAVCIQPGDQSAPQLIPDGQGGAIIVWSDPRGGNADIYVQRLGPTGLPKWTANGIVICSATEHQYDSSLTTDGQGGAIIAWRDRRNYATNGYDIYAQRVNSDGITQWTVDGVAVCTLSYDQGLVKTVADGQGGAILFWGDYRAGTSSQDIYAQSLSSTGALMWAAGGVAISTATGDQYPQEPIPDGMGGAIIAWQDHRSGVDIYAQRIDASGGVKWAVAGLAVCTATGNQWAPNIAPDGQGGAIVTWYDGRSGTNAIFVQRVSANGVNLWTANGVAITTALINDRRDPVIIPDGLGGAIVSWYDNRNGNSDIYAQRVNSGGLPLWTANGVPVCVAADSQYGIDMIPDGNGGSLITWLDQRTSGTTGIDIYAQRLNSSGGPQWIINGLAITTASLNQYYPYLTLDCQGGAIFAWQDWRNGGIRDIYAQRISLTQSTIEINEVMFGPEFPSNWYSQSWTCRKPVTVTNSGGALSDFQVQVKKPILDETGLAAAWHFDEGANQVAWDNGTRLNNGQLGSTTGADTNDPAWVGGKSGKALDFDGSNDYVAVPDSATLDIISAGSVEAWVYMQSETDEQGILIKGTSSTSYGYGLHYENNINKKCFTFFIDHDGTWGTASDMTQVFTADYSVPMGGWHHVVGTWDATTTSIYLDGVLADSAVTAGLPFNAGHLRIGGGSTGWTYANAIIDEVRVYSRALEAEDVQQRYGLIAKGDYSDVRFTDSDGTTVLDYWAESDGSFWVQVPSIPAGSTKTIYIYYGNKAAGPASSGNNTFDQFDDFWGAAIDGTKWTQGGFGNAATGYSVSSGCLNIDLTGNGLSIGDLNFKSNTLIPSGSIANYVFEVRAYADQSGGAASWAMSGMGAGYPSAPPEDQKFMVGWNGCRQHYSLHSWNGAVQETQISATDANWYTYYLHIASSSSATGMMGTNTASGSWSITSPSDYEFILGGQTEAQVVYNFDWFRVRKFASPEPTTVLGAEENKGDWFELYNPTQTAYDLHGWKLVDGAGNTIHQYASPVMNPGDYEIQYVGTSLDSTDCLILVDQDGAIRDAVAWGTSGSPPSGTYYNLAVSSENWHSGTYVDTASFVAGNTLARDGTSTDTNGVADWDPSSGVNSAEPTPDDINAPEFATVIIPIVIAIAPLWLRRARRRIAASE